MLKCPYFKFLPVSVFTIPKTVLAKKNTNYYNCQNGNYILATGKRTDGTFGILGKPEKQFGVGGQAY